MTYIVNGFLKNVEEDSYKEGCLPESGYSLDYDLTIKSDTKEGILEEVKNIFDVTDGEIEINACDEDGLSGQIYQSFTRNFK